MTPAPGLPTSDVAGTILAAVERYGVLLVHDRRLPSVTAVVTGAPVAGSWWSHPMANAIYNALGEIDDEVATVKLLAGKNTLVARRYWPDLACIGLAHDPWQLVGLDPAAEALLAEVDTAGDPVVAGPAHRRVADVLEQRLLVYPTELHTDSGRHVKAYQGWRRWSHSREVAVNLDSVHAKAVFEHLATAMAGMPSPGHPRPAWVRFEALSTRRKGTR
jgi:hypothetical protein